MTGITRSRVAALFARHRGEKATEPDAPAVLVKFSVDAAAAGAALDRLAIAVSGATAPATAGFASLAAASRLQADSGRPAAPAAGAPATTPVAAAGGGGTGNAGSGGVEEFEPEPSEVREAVVNAGGRFKPGIYRVTFDGLARRTSVIPWPDQLDVAARSLDTLGDAVEDAAEAALRGAHGVSVVLDLKVMGGQILHRGVPVGTFTVRRTAGLPVLDEDAGVS